MMIKKIRKKFAFAFLFLDVGIIILSVFIAPMVRFQKFGFVYYTFSEPQLFIVILIYLLILFSFNFYDVTSIKNYPMVALNLFFAVFLIYLLTAAIFYFFPGQFGRGIWLIQAVFSYIGILLIRFIFYSFYSKRITKKRLLMVGVGLFQEDIIRMINAHDYTMLIGAVTKSGQKDNTHVLPVLGSIKEVHEIIKKHKIDALIITDKTVIDYDLERTILHLKMKGILIYDIPRIVEDFAGKVPIDSISHLWLIFNTFSGVHNNLYNLRIKRLIDITVSIFFFVLFLPLMFLVGVLIKLTSSGPVLYKQSRVGKDEGIYPIYKFRSMKQNAEENGAVWAKQNDNRITFIGKIIRKLRIDELPQVVNVLKGDMTLVGPRPERPEFVTVLKEEIPYYSIRHMIKPGITGWAQVKYPYGASVADAKEKLKYDLYYMRRVSFKLDVIIMLKTLRTVLFGSGAR